MIATAIVCVTVLALAMLVREDRRVERAERALARKADGDAEAREERLADLERRAEGWTATSRQVTGMLERRAKQ